MDPQPRNPDDDELQIVQENINPTTTARRTRSRRHVLDDDVLEIVEEHITTAPPRTRSHSLSISDDVAVVVETPAAQTSNNPIDVNCAACRNPLPTCKPCTTTASANVADALTFKTFKLSRCRHALCIDCVIKSITAFTTTSAAGDADGADGAQSERPLLPSPMCVAPRCRAPFSSADVQNALAHPDVDGHFQHSFDQFVKWTDAADADGDEEEVTFGPSFITFPDLDPGVDAQIIADDDHFTDDTESAYGLLWIWDKDHVHPSSGNVGQWMCAACGAYHAESRAKTFGAGASNVITNANANATATEVDDDGEDEVEIQDDAMPDDIPDYPMRPHCARARAYAVRECIARLSKVAEEAESKPASGRGGRGRRGRGRGRTKRTRTTKSTTTTTTKRRRTTSTGFAKGTGFAGRQGAEWKGATSKMLENTRKIDLHTAHWLARIRCYLIWQSDAHDAWPGYMRTLLRDSQLAEHLARVLINESIMDVGERVPVYVAALRVVAALNDSPSLRILVAENRENGRSLASLIDSLSKQAALLSNGAAKDQTMLEEETKQLIRQIRKAVRGVHRHKLLGDNPGANRFDLRLTGDAPDIEIPQPNPDDQDDADDDKKENVSEERQKKYCEVMKELQFATVPNLAKASAFRGEGNKGASAARRSSMRRVVSEVSSLLSSLPISWSSTIVVRVDEDRYDYLRACVFGPEDTPYECGAFLFDIFLPPDYPDSPPKFKLLTTGNGRVRFNPNLYANGKVCLSLLGTWTGPSWTAASTLLQVLVSIQSLIFVPEPFFNEPGFERWCGTEKGKKNSESYNVGVRQNTVRWAMLDALKNPFNEFRTVIQAHFRLKRGVVESVMRDWFKKPPTPAPTNRAVSSSAGPAALVSSAGTSGASAAAGAVAAAVAADPLGNLTNTVNSMSNAIAEMGNFVNTLANSVNGAGGSVGAGASVGVGPAANIQQQMQQLSQVGTNGAGPAAFGAAMQNAMTSFMANGIPIIMDHAQNQVPNIEKVVADVIKELDKLEEQVQVKHQDDVELSSSPAPDNINDDAPIAIL